MSDKPPKFLLHRLVQKLRAQDWSAAAIELVIVVLGIFLGFQLTAWNESRQDLAREETYLLNVARDLRDDVAEMDENSRTAASRMAALDLLLTKTGDWDPPAAFPSSRYLIEVQEVPPFDTDAGYTVGIETFLLSTLDGNRFAYNTLISADGMEVIRDQELLRDIQKYYAAVDEVRDFETSLEENRLRMLDALQESGVSAVSGLSFDEIAQILQARPALKAAVENYWLYANRHVFLTDNLSANANEMAVRIDRLYGE